MGYLGKAFKKSNLRILSNYLLVGFDNLQSMLLEFSFDTVSKGTDLYTSVRLSYDLVYLHQTKLLLSSRQREEVYG